MSWWKVRVTALSPPLRIVYNTVHLKPFLSTFHLAYERCGSSNSSLHGRRFFACVSPLRKKAAVFPIFPSPPPPRFFVSPQKPYLLLNEPQRKNSPKNCLLRRLVKLSQPLSSSAHENAYSCRKFCAYLAETFHLKASFYKLRLVVFLTVSFSVGFKLQKGSCRSSGWRRNQSTLEDLQSLAIFGCLVSCPFSDNYWEGQIVKPRWMQVAVVYPFFFQTRLRVVSYFLRIIKRAKHAREKN